MRRIMVVNGKNLVRSGGKRFYVGRKSSWKEELGRDFSGLGNPFLIGKDGDREDVVRKYMVWLIPKLKKGREDLEKELFFMLVDEVKENDIELVCWCKPALCHGDVLKKFVEMYLRKGC